MAAIHILASAESERDVSRQLKVLELAAAKGADLGSRGHHIRALGGSLALLSRDLQRATDDLRILLDHLVVEGLPLVGLTDVDAHVARLRALLKDLASASAELPQH